MNGMVMMNCRQELYSYHSNTFRIKCCVGVRIKSIVTNLSKVFNPLNLYPTACTDASKLIPAIYWFPTDFSLNDENSLISMQQTQICE